jgi:integrase
MARSRGVYERVKGSSVWWVRYADSDGAIRREKAGTKTAAMKLYNARKQDALEGKKLPYLRKAAAIKFGTLLDAAIEHHERGANKRCTCRTGLVRISFGTMAAGSITPQMISRWLTGMQSEHKWRPATANRYKALFSLAFRLGMENNLVQRNPARAVRSLRESNERTRFLTAVEEGRLRCVIESEFPEHLPELEIALHTGMRQGEQYGLQWRDVDMTSRRLTLRRTKNGTMRHIPLNEVALGAFEVLWLRSKGDGSVFVSRRGGDPLLKPRFWWDKVVDRANVHDFRWHDLRHTFASRCVMLGVDLRTLQQLLGHKTRQMVVRYTHLSQSQCLQPSKGSA